MARDYQAELLEIEKQRQANNEKIHEEGQSERKRLESAITEYPEHKSLYGEEIKTSQKREDEFIAANDRTSLAKKEQVKADEFQDRYEAALDVPPPTSGPSSTSQTYSVTPGTTLGDPTIAQTQNVVLPDNLEPGRGTPIVDPPRPPEPTQATVLRGMQKGLDGIENASTPTDLVMPMVILGVAAAAMVKDSVQRHMQGVDKVAEEHASPGTTQIQNAMRENVNATPEPDTKVATMHIEGGSPAQASNMNIIVPPPPPPKPPAPTNDNVQQI